MRPSSRRPARKPLLDAPVTRHRVLYSLDRKALLLDRVDHCLQRDDLRLLTAVADEHRVAAGGDCSHGAVGRSDTARSTLSSRMSSLRTSPPYPSSRFKHAVDERRRERRGPLLVEGGHEDVRRHDRGDLLLDRRLERRELDTANPVRVVLDDRQLFVRVGDRVAVSREVLPARGDTCGLQRADDDAPEPGHLLRHARRRRDRR